jgi:hypothetical protein
MERVESLFSAMVFTAVTYSQWYLLPSAQHLYRCLHAYIYSYVSKSTPDVTEDSITSSDRVGTF